MDNIQNSFLHCLRYGVYKNYGALLENLGAFEDAVDYYLLATQIDSSDPSLWIKLGSISRKIKDISTACFAFENGLQASQSTLAMVKCLKSLSEVRIHIDMRTFN